MARISILHAPTAAAASAATDQAGQRGPVLTKFGAGGVAVRYYAGATLVQTEVQGPCEPDALSPLGFNLGAVVRGSSVVIVDDALISHAILRAADGDDVLLIEAADLALANLRTRTGRVITLSDPVVGELRVTANSSLPASGTPDATAFTLALSATSGTNGVPVTVTVTPNGPVPSGGASVTLAASNGGVLGATSLSFTSGSTAAQTTTLTRSTAGTSAVTMTNNRGLTNTGSPASFTSAAVGVAVSNITLTSPTTATAPFAVAQAFKQGDIPAGSGVVVTGADAQATIKNTWPDGSAKIALVSGTAALTAATPATISFSAGTASAGTALTTTDLKNALTQQVTVDAGAFGAASWSNTDWDSPFQTWVSGHRMSSWVYRKPIGSDAHLVAWLEVRLFAGGEVEVLPWVENGYFNVASPTSKSATYSFFINAASRFSAAIDLPAHCRTPLVSGSLLSHWLGTDPGVTVKHDAAYMMATELVPTYWASVSPSASIVTSLPSTYTPLQQGSFPAGMGAAGADPSIGLLPEWDVLALTTTANVSAAIQRNAYSAGRYGIHHRDETTNRPPRFSSYPTTVFGEGFGIIATGASTTGTYTPDATGTVPPDWAQSHHPSVGFMAYLLTGRFYHLETVQFAATANHFKRSDSPREGASGVLQTWASNSTRGAAWSLRTLAHAAAITPAADTPLATEFTTAFANNITRQHSTYAGDAQGTLGFMEPSSGYFDPITSTTGAGSTTTNVVLNGTSSTDDQYNKVFSNGGTWTLTINGQTRPVVDYVGSTFTAVVSPAFTVAVASQSFTLASGHYYEAAWQQDFYTAALGYSKCLGIPLDAPTKTKHDEFFAWKAKSIVGRFGGLGSGEYLFRDAATYSIAIAEADSWTAQYSDWGKVWTDTRLYNSYGTGLKELGDGSLRGTVSMMAFWGNLQPALAYAVRHGVAGAEQARIRMVSATNWAALEADADTAPVWSVRPPRPAWRDALAPWQWTNFPAASISNTLPAVMPPPPSNQKNRVEAYCGKVVWRKVYGSAANGGHADWSGNDVLGANLGVASPGAPVMLRQPTPNAYLLDNTSHYAVEPDGKQRPTSTHSYYCQFHDFIHDQLLRMGVMAGNGNGNFNAPNVDAFDLATGDWLPPNTLPSCPEPMSFRGAQCQHPITGDIYVSGETRLWRWNLVARTWTALALFPQNGTAVQARASCVDTKRNRVVFLGDAYRVGSNGVLIYDIASNTFSTADLSGTDAPLVVVASANGGHYDPRRDRYVVRASWSTIGGVFKTGDDLLEVHPTTWAVTTLATTSGASIPATNTGTWGLLQPMPALDGFVMEPLGTGGVRFLTWGR